MSPEHRPLPRSDGSRPRTARDRRLAARLRSHSFSVISNDCWGAEVYRLAEMPYRTPFVGLFVRGPDFLALVRGLPRHLEADLREDRSSAREVGYPVGRLLDARIDFMHHASFEVAEASWRRRLSRTEGPFRIKAAVGKDGFTDDISTELAAAHGAMVLGPRGACAANVIVEPYSADGRELFAPSLRCVDLARWIATGEIRRARLW